MDAMLISFSYLSHQMQTREEAVTDRTYALHTAQAAELAQKILAQLLQMKSAEPQGTGLPKH